MGSHKVAAGAGGTDCWNATGSAGGAAARDGAEPRQGVRGKGRGRLEDTGPRRRLRGEGAGRVGEAEPRPGLKGRGRGRVGGAGHSRD